MSTLILREFGDFTLPDSLCLDLAQLDPAPCIGCWTCWWKTPGICIHRDLEEFYRGYVNADRAVFFAKLENGFLSSRLKTLLDRMIPLFLPYTFFAKGGTWHSPRYPRYPDVALYYQGGFRDAEEASLFHDYIQKVFEQFHSKEICIRPVDEFQEAAR